jgi:hypothetical protein
MVSTQPYTLPCPDMVNFGWRFAQIQIPAHDVAQSGHA